MPTYEYKCEACGHAFEKFQSMSAAPVKKCPECGKAKVRRLISSGAGLIFKGSGFYITDYRDKSYTDSAKADSGETKSETKSDSKAETKSDAKTETKSESKGSEAKTESKPKSEPKSEPKSAPKSEKPRKK